MVTLSGSDRQASRPSHAHGRAGSCALYGLSARSQLSKYRSGCGHGQWFLKLLSLQDLRKQEVQAGKTREEVDAIQKNPWQAYQGSLKGELNLPETVLTTLTVEGKRWT